VSRLTYGNFITELRATWDVTLDDDDCAIGDLLMLRRTAPGGVTGFTPVTHRLSNAMFSQDELELVRTILRRLKIPENIFDHMFNH
jgi:hypothetical protein